mmetsp:Transcript_9284/g.26033  ORF Transcript_9284/g.26033 Transcript_9284/m.26033 type:complete len:256 (+) Transcript_9284:96-863(+)|eukprot:CAMPEP_0179242780 /NCGR_PEP_ID=MMETSP0797-20121207/17195_1 /TAXON_ID=47934 /ORGANISM="Dinophysis acuminata, Strain DAEP01" /LENGTH=255 /DNA_ID=CAMNT_0020950229 /DNA_START=90 /DNA_END=857 /DNA_ORIENTATION=+
MKIHSEGHRINPGASLEYRIVASEPSLLEFEWQTEDELEVKFSLTFEPEEGGKNTVLIAPKNSKSRRGTVEINDPGTCLLLWTNYYTLFQSPVLRYFATVRNRQEILDEESREAEAQRAEEERQAITARIPVLREEIAKLQQDKAEQEDLFLRREAKVIAMRQQLAAKEEDLQAVKAYAEMLDSTTAARLEELASLEARLEPDPASAGGDTADHGPTDQAAPDESQGQPTAVQETPAEAAVARQASGENVSSDML